MAQSFCLVADFAYSPSVKCLDLSDLLTDRTGLSLCIHFVCLLSAGGDARTPLPWLAHLFFLSCTDLGPTGFFADDVVLVCTMSFSLFGFFSSAFLMISAGIIVFLSSASMTCVTVFS